MATFSWILPITSLIPSEGRQPQHTGVKVVAAGDYSQNSFHLDAKNYVLDYMSIPQYRLRLHSKNKTLVLGNALPVG